MTGRVTFASLPARDGSAPSEPQPERSETSPPSARTSRLHLSSLRCFQRPRLPSISRWFHKASGKDRSDAGTGTMRPAGGPPIEMAAPPVQEIPGFAVEGREPDEAERQVQALIRQHWTEAQRLGMTRLGFPARLFSVLHGEGAIRSTSLPILSGLLSRNAEWVDYQQGSDERKREILGRIFTMLAWVENTVAASDGMALGTRARQRFFSAGRQIAEMQGGNGEMLSVMWHAMHNADIANGNGAMTAWDPILTALHQQFIKQCLASEAAQLYRMHIEPSMQAEPDESRRRALSTTKALVEMTLGEESGLVEPCRKVADEMDVAGRLTPAMWEHVKGKVAARLRDGSGFIAFLQKSSLRDSPLYKRELEEWWLKPYKEAHSSAEDATHEGGDAAAAKAHFDAAKAYFDAAKEFTDAVNALKSRQPGEALEEETRQFLRDKAEQFTQRHADTVRLHFPKRLAGSAPAPQGAASLASVPVGEISDGARQ